MLQSIKFILLGHGKTKQGHKKQTQNQPKKALTRETRNSLTKFC